MINERCFTEGIPKKIFVAKIKSIEPILKFLEKDFPSVVIWDISNITCPGENCFGVTSDKQYLQDESHLFMSSATLSDELIIDLNKLLAASRDKEI